MDENAEYPTPYKVGTVVMARHLCGNNDVGGTAFYNNAEPWPVQITKAFWDYEAGWRFHGLLVEPEHITMARQKGTTGFTADDYRDYPNNPDLAIQAEKAAASFNPARVYLSEWDIDGRRVYAATTIQR